MGRWAIGMWPGLPQLWRRGDWSGLGLALGFALLLNLVLLTTFVWTELVSSSVAAAAWIAVVGVWSASLVSAWRRGFELDGPPTAQEDLFPTAIAEYLRGNWYDVEQICRRLLQRNDRDVEAHLLLATTCRHTIRYDEAQRRLEQLTTFDAAGRWAWEIRDEFERLKSAREAAAERAATDAAEQSLEPELKLREAA